MKILQLIYESFGSPFGFGGAGVRAYEIYKRLKAQHDITFLCMKYPGAIDGEIFGLKHIFVGAGSKRLTRNVFSYTVKAAEYVKKFGDNFDVIIENFLPATPFFSKFLTRTPVILQIQGLWGLHYVKKFNVFYGLPMYVMEKIYLKLYNTFILVTDVNMNKVIRRSEKCAIIPNGIDREFLRVNNEEDDYILFLSRIDIYQKGLDILVDAFRLIAEKFKDLRLVLAGYAFSNVDDLMKRIPVGLRDRINYVGFVSGEEKLRLLSKAKAFVLPSRLEAHPVSVLEALACGKAVLVSDIPELRYIIENDVGLTFKNNSSRDLADKLSVLLKDKGLRHTIGEKGRRFAFNYLWDDMALVFELFLKEVVSGQA
ncbi:MAG: glycosyltransferase family 4 protein [Nitrospirota bacterium]